MAYVFLHLLPGLVEHKETIGAVLSEYYEMSPMMDLTVYMVGLLGFLLFFGLGRMAEWREEKLGRTLPSDFYLHIAAFCIYNGLLTYTMPIRVEADLSFAVLFTLVVGLHCVLVDRNLERHYPNQFDHRGRFILIACLFAGWGLAAYTEPNNVLVAAILTAFIGGSILVNVFHNELPSTEKSSFAAFTVGIVVGTALLYLVTALETAH